MASFLGSGARRLVKAGTEQLSELDVVPPRLAKAMCFYPVSIPADGAGLNFTSISYNGVMWVSMVSCREMVPDPNFMLVCMQGAWDELLAATNALPGQKKG